MATITERVTKSGQKRYTTQVRVRGAKPITKTFQTKTEAKAFAASIESDIRRGAHLPAQESQRRTLAEAIDRYTEAVLPTKRPSTANSQGLQLRYWKKRLGHKVLATITTPVIADERDHLLGGETRTKTLRTPATVTRYLALLSHVFSYAERELQWVSSNPAKAVTKPKEPRGRCRILTDEEREELLAGCRASKNTALFDIVILALSTGMRRGEIRNLEWRHIDFDRRMIVLTETKNGDRRVVPIRGECERVLRERSKIRRIDSPHVFPAPYHPGRQATPVDFQSAWNATVERAGIEDFRFHDLRHCAASEFAMAGATLAELAELLGHRTLAMVARYSHFVEGHTGPLVEKMNSRLFDAKDTRTAT